MPDVRNLGPQQKRVLFDHRRTEGLIEWEVQ